MTKFTLSTYDAQPSSYGGYSIAMKIGGGGYPDRTLEARNTAAALAAFDAFAAEVATHGKPLAVSIRVAKGERAPAGWRALKQRDTTKPVNVPGAA